MNLQKTFGNGNVKSEYSYLVAPSTKNFDLNDGSYYQYTAFVHPLMNGELLCFKDTRLLISPLLSGTKVSILELEFYNSTNRVIEIAEYKAKTSFM